MSRSKGLRGSAVAQTVLQVCNPPQLLVLSICKEGTRIARPPPPWGPGVSWEPQTSFHVAGQGQREVARGEETPPIPLTFLLL